MNHLQRTLGLLSRLAPGVAAHTASLLFTLPRRFRRPARERLVLEQGSRRTVPSCGRELAVWEWGATGPRVLLAHGWEGRGSQMGAFVQPLLEAGFRVVAFDQAAHGDSPGRTNSLHGFAEGIRSVVDAVGPVHGVVAHSFGAMATTIAIRRGLQVESLVFVGPAAWTDDSVASWARTMGVNSEVVERVRQTSEARYGIRWSDLLGRNLGRGRTQPLLIVHDREDAEVRLEAAEGLAASWPDCRLVVTEGLGHRRILSDAAVTAQAAFFLRSGYAPPLERLRPDPWEAFLRGDVSAVA